MLATAAATTSSHQVAWAKQSKSANERLGIGVIGTGGRGNAHAEAFAKRKDCEVLFVCDADLARARAAAAKVARIQKKAPQAVQDLREICDDDSVDAVSIASCNHWHALSAIWAMQAGKDVYVEKPVSHNVSEGRRIVQAARKYGRICQAGTQYRSHGSNKAMAEFVQSGKLGKTTRAYCLVGKRRGSIGSAGKHQPPSSVDYNLYCGPAPLAKVTRSRFHYDWHWFWDFGNGDLGNSGIHRIDVARMVLGLEGLGRGVWSYGGRFGYTDSGETPNTQVSIHDFGEKSLICEVHGLETTPYKGMSNGLIIEGADGCIASTQTSAVVFDSKGKKVQTLKGESEDHFDNFVKAVRSRKRADLNAEIEEGHLSSALCHLGNISYRCGTQGPHHDLKKLGPRESSYHQTAQRHVDHLEANGVDLEKNLLTHGKWFELDSKKEIFVDSDEANALLVRADREPFVVPATLAL